MNAQAVLKLKLAPAGRTATRPVPIRRSVQQCEGLTLAGQSAGALRPQPRGAPLPQYLVSLTFSIAPFGGRDRPRPLMSPLVTDDAFHTPSS